jgi:hypothetical protein
MEELKTNLNKFFWRQKIFNWPQKICKIKTKKFVLSVLRSRLWFLICLGLKHSKSIQTKENVSNSFQLSYILHELKNEEFENTTL